MYTALYIVLQESVHDKRVRHILCIIIWIRHKTFVHYYYCYYYYYYDDDDDDEDDNVRNDYDGSEMKVFQDTRRCSV